MAISLFRNLYIWRIVAWLQWVRIS